MRDISKFLRDLNDLSGNDRALAEESNALLREYEHDMDAIETVYDILGYRPWYIDFDENEEIAACIWSDRYRKKLGYESEKDFPNELKSWENIIDERDHERVVKLFWEVVADREGKKRFDIEYVAHKKNGELRNVHSVGVVRRRSDGSPLTFVGLTEDVTAEKQNLKELQEQYEIVEALSRDYLNVFMVDIPNKTASIIKLNGYVTEGFGDVSKRTYPYEPFCAQYIKDRVYIEDQEMLKEKMSIDKVKEEMDKNGQYECGYRAVDNGEIHFYQFTYLKIKSKSGDEKVIAGFKNIDVIVASAKERDYLKELSETDVMTGVFNRGHGEKVSREHVNSGGSGMLCIFDLDRFKDINDTYGHNAGDKALISVAGCLKRTFGSDDIVFRLGGDEFAALAKDIMDVTSGKELIGRFFKEIESLDLPELSGNRIYTSVGAVVFDAGDGEDFEDLYKKADKCVYASKKESGNSVTISA